MKVPELNLRIEQHANAVIARDDHLAESFVAPAGLDAWRTAVAAIGDQRPLRGFELLACAKIGRQFIAKTRFEGGSDPLTLLIRWKDIDGIWTIADAENITGKRSPWSDIPHYANERRGSSNA
jgi:hypothetical protein